MPDDGEVVGDEEERDAELLLQVLQKVHHLRLDRHVEGADGLVGDDQLGPYGERAGDSDPLPLPAGELVRIAVVVLGVEADHLEELLDAGQRPAAWERCCAPAGAVPMIAPTVCRGFSEEYGSWKMIWISRRNGSSFFCDRLPISVPSKRTLPAGRVEQPSHQSPSGRLPAPGLADEAERLSSRHRE